MAIKKILIAGAAGAIALGLGSAAWSHHAVNAQFDVNKEGSLTGTLARLDNVQPHSFWYFVVNNNGKVEKWSLEGPSPTLLRRSGLQMKRDMVVGRQFKVYFNTARDGSTTGYIRGVDVAGKRVNLQADYVTN